MYYNAFMSDEEQVSQTNEAPEPSSTDEPKGPEVLEATPAVQEFSKKFGIEGVTLSPEEQESLQKIADERERLLFACRKEEVQIVEQIQTQLELSPSLPRFSGIPSREEISKSAGEFCKKLMAGAYPDDEVLEIAVDGKSIMPRIFVNERGDRQQTHLMHHSKFIELLVNSGVDVGRLGYEEYATLYGGVESRMVRLGRIDSRERSITNTANESAAPVFAEAAARNFEEAISRTLAQTEVDGLQTELNSMLGILNGMAGIGFWEQAARAPQDSYPSAAAALESMAGSFLRLSRGRAAMSPELNEACGRFFDENERAIEAVLYDSMDRKFFKAEELKGSVHDEESERVFFFGDSPQQIAEKRERNYVRVAEFLNELAAKRVKEITVAEVERIQALSCDAIIPACAMGVRSQEIKTSNEGGDEGRIRVPKERVRKELEHLLDRAGAAVNAKIPDSLFTIKQGKVFAEFADIHPLNDGNGQTGVFLLEAMAGQRGLGVHEKFKSDFYDRLLDALQGNKLAFVFTALVTEVKVKHSYKTVPSDEEE